MRKFQSNEFLKIFKYFGDVYISMRDALTDDVAIAVFLNNGCYKNILLLEIFS